MNAAQPEAEQDLDIDYDDTPRCECHLRQVNKAGHIWDIEPPCEAPADWIATTHTPTGCTVGQHLYCNKHFDQLFLQDTRPCIICGATRLISHRPL